MQWDGIRELLEKKPQLKNKDLDWIFEEVILEASFSMMILGEHF